MEGELEQRQEKRESRYTGEMREGMREEREDRRTGRVFVLRLGANALRQLCSVRLIGALLGFWAFGSLRAALKPERGKRRGRHASSLPSARAAVNYDRPGGQVAAPGSVRRHETAPDRPGSGPQVLANRHVFSCHF